MRADMLAKSRKFTFFHVLIFLNAEELDRTGTDVSTLHGGTNRLSRYKLLLH